MKTEFFSYEIKERKKVVKRAEDCKIENDNDIKEFVIVCSK